VSTRRILLAAALSCLLAGALAPVAAALQASVRVEASAETVAPRTTVSVVSAPLFFDSDGNPYATKKPNALAALAAASGLRDFTWEAQYGGTFVTGIAGYSSLPDWSEGWVYAVNGAGYPVIDVAAIDFSLASGDEVLWMQSPDNTFARGSVALVTEVSTTAGTVGDDLVVTVKADDLTKVDSQADYARYGLSDPARLETPDEFAPVEGAVLHVGSATYTTPANGTVTVAAPAAGDYRIWAEKEMDATTWYVRSPKTVSNFAPALALTDIAISPASFRPGAQRPRVSFTLSRAADLKLQVRNAKNRTVWSKTVREAAGPGTFTWNGKGTSGALVPRRAAYTLRVSAVDSWGRATPVTTLKLTTR
jgi:hypothetical protein